NKNNDRKGLTMATEVPFRLVGGAQPLIVLPTFLNGLGPFDFALDTGAGTTILSPELAERLDLRVTQTREGVGAGGRIRAGLARAASLAAGAAVQLDSPVAITAE